MKHICSPLVCDYDKLKRKNALMRRWLPMFIEACGKDKAWQEVMSEMSRKMPDLFKAKMRGSK